MTDSWERLSLYESRDLLSRFYKEQHDRKLGENKAYQIIAHLTQGRAYFTSAHTSSEIVRPLLLYYGVLALSRGLILFLDETGMTDDNLSPSHGIEAHGWQATLKSINRLPDLQLKFTEGTFRELSRVTSNRERFRVQIHDFYQHVFSSLTRPGSIEINTSTPIKLRDVLERLVWLDPIFTTTFKESSKYVRADLEILPSPGFYPFRGFSPLQGANLYVRYLRYNRSITDMSSVAATIPAEWKLNRDSDVSHSAVFTLMPYVKEETSKDFLSESEFLAKLPSIKSDGTGQTYLVEPLPSGLDFSSLSLLYLIAYSMGMLARYYPSKWLSLLNSEKGDFAFPLMKAATTLVEDQFPRLVLQELVFGNEPELHSQKQS